MHKRKVLVIIPAYNEEKNIEQVIRNIENEGEKCTYKVDYLVVDDCSQDHTLDLLNRTDKSYVSLSVNLGIGGGMQCGYCYALEHGYDAAVQMDADGQHDSKYLDTLVRPVLEGEADITVGSRFITKEGFQSSLVRRLGIRFLSVLLRIVCGVDVKDVTSGFRVVNVDVIRFFAKNYAQDYPEPESLAACARKNFRIYEIPVVMHQRCHGKSSISPVRSLYYIIKVSIGILVEGFL